MFHHTVTITRELLLPSAIQAPHAVPTTSRCYQTHQSHKHRSTPQSAYIHIDVYIFTLLNLRNSTSWMLFSSPTTSHYVGSAGSRDVTVICASIKYGPPRSKLSKLGSWTQNCADIDDSSLGSMHVNDPMLGVKNDLGLQWPGYYSSNIANRHIAKLYKYSISLLFLTT